MSLIRLGIVGAAFGALLLGAVGVAESDRIAVQNPKKLAGTWDLSLTVNHSTCLDVSVGDVVAKQWLVSVKRKSVRAKAIGGEKWELSKWRGKFQKAFPSFYFWANDGAIGERTASVELSFIAEDSVAGRYLDIRKSIVARGAKEQKQLGRVQAKSTGFACVVVYDVRGKKR